MNIQPDWYMVDGKWRHLQKVTEDNAITFYCDGVVETIIKLDEE
jgi:hypothetical protein